MFALYDYVSNEQSMLNHSIKSKIKITKQYPKHKLSQFPPKVNPFKSEATIISERQAAFEKIVNEMFSDPEISESFPFLHFFKVKDQVTDSASYRTHF